MLHWKSIILKKKGEIFKWAEWYKNNTYGETRGAGESTVQIKKNVAMYIWISGGFTIFVYKIWYRG